MTIFHFSATRIKSDSSDNKAEHLLFNDHAVDHLPSLVKVIDEPDDLVPQSKQTTSLSRGGALQDLLQCVQRDYIYFNRRGVDLPYVLQVSSPSASLPFGSVLFIGSRHGKAVCDPQEDVRPGW